jgi:hypothetical protein
MYGYECSPQFLENEKMHVQYVHEQYLMMHVFHGTQVFRLIYSFHNCFIFPTFSAWTSLKRLYETKYASGASELVPCYFYMQIYVYNYLNCMTVREIWVFIHTRKIIIPDGNAGWGIWFFLGESIFISPENSYNNLFKISKQNKTTLYTCNGVILLDKLVNKSYEWLRSV